VSEPGRVQKKIVLDYLTGEGRKAIQSFVPRYMAFPVGRYEPCKTLDIATTSDAIKDLFTWAWRKRFGRGGSLCARVCESASRKRVNRTQSKFGSMASPATRSIASLRCSACAATDGDCLWEARSRCSPAPKPR
jgi:hypothetical protein